jgi:phosphatidylserine/phosphatidylglycerophosphate/cardiolipin synthase-like enzyme
LTPNQFPAKLRAMSSVHSVSSQADRPHLPTAHRARVRIVCRDVFGSFVRAAILERPSRITVISPWLGDPETGRFGRVLAHAEEHGAAVLLVTRPPVSPTHSAAIAATAQMPRGRVHLNAKLHAKLYVCESENGRGVAVLGSANGTDRSATLDEIGLIIRADRGSEIITHLGRHAVRELLAEGAAARHQRRRT